jgi:putative PIN family toxin of toxin-antitoxin system
VRVVVDTSVWVSANINRAGFPAQVIRAFVEGRFTLVTSEPILKELGDVLARPRITARTRLTAAERETLLALIREKALLVPVAGDVKLCRDHEDDAVIETALRGEVDLVVSRDEDITRGWEVVEPLARAGIRILTVRRFLEALDVTGPPTAEPPEQDEPPW